MELGDPTGFSDLWRRKAKLNTFLVLKLFDLRSSQVKVTIFSYPWDLSGEMEAKGHNN